MKNKNIFKFKNSQPNCFNIIYDNILMLTENGGFIEIDAYNTFEEKNCFYINMYDSNGDIIIGEEFILELKSKKNTETVCNILNGLFKGYTL